MSLVLDSSATLGWIYPDEASDETARIFEQVVTSGAWVPSLWRLEGCQQPADRNPPWTH